MNEDRRTVGLLVVGTLLVLATLSGPASAGEPQDGTEPAASAVLQETAAGGGNASAPAGRAAGQEGQGISGAGSADGAAPSGQGSGQENAYRNTRNLRNVEQSRYASRAGSAGTAQGRGFADENGDGTNDLAPDHDSDGVPNCQDPDWGGSKRDGSGQQQGNRSGQGGNRGQRAQSSGCPRTR
jgi:hypothetical protein